MMTKLRVVKWGDSLAVRLPKDFAERLGLDVGDDIQFAYQLPNGEWRTTGGARADKTKRSGTRAAVPAVDKSEV
jgi:antitoxin component of MazEF toxin-antitoxin module